MADRIHPRHSGSVTDEENPNPNVNLETFSVEQETPVSDTRPMLEKPITPSGTYVVQVPKDQIYRFPSPENAARYERYSRGKPRRGCCCRCFCCCFSFIVTLIVLIGIAALVFYLVVKPKAPSYSVSSISIVGFNLNQLTSQTLTPEFDVYVSADNPNTKIGIYYEPSSSVEIYSSSNVKLSNGTVPVFYQPTQNVTVFEVIMKGTVPLTTALNSTLLQEQSAGKIPLELYCNVPVKLKIGSVSTWKITVKVTCNIVVNSLSTNSNIVSKSCSAKVNVF
ncbi:hypothetical protein NE237_008572 [Protea cynaroides]|uniref:Late embryogenesis abundant protein LEA-2 subgroup domain-containing protein n=1 Tax=Protea cynaroides TaxID=273540 RepID=A0A9Q0KW46_9MAGN|nr:hypothetical protein NE237_008572 [Protea cynaroides]